MGNPFRLDEPGSFHHVFSRAAEGRSILTDPRDRLDLEDRIARQATAGAFHVHACTLMSNHFHLLLERLEVPLSRSMHWILTGFAVEHNLRHEHRGHVFQSRFRSILVEDGAYLFELVRYIHLNPLRAGIVSDLASLAGYEGSSHAHVMGSRRMPWISTELLERLLGSLHSEGWRERYLSFLDGEYGCPLTELRLGSHLLDRSGIHRNRDDVTTWKPGQARVLGSQEFARRIYRERAGTRGFRLRSREEEHVRMCAVTAAVAGFSGLTAGSLRGSGRSVRLSRARRILIRLLTEEEGLSRSDIARFMGLSVTAVTKSLQVVLDAQDVITIRAIKP